MTHECCCQGSAGVWRKFPHLHREYTLTYLSSASKFRASPLPRSHRCALLAPRCKGRLCLLLFHRLDTCAPVRWESPRCDAYASLSSIFNRATRARCRWGGPQRSPSNSRALRALRSAPSVNIREGYTIIRAAAKTDLKTHLLTAQHTLKSVCGLKVNRWTSLITLFIADSLWISRLKMWRYGWIKVMNRWVLSIMRAYWGNGLLSCMRRTQVSFYRLNDLLKLVQLFLRPSTVWKIILVCSIFQILL